MRKLVLDAEDLRVESFETMVEGPSRGTVAAREWTGFECPSAIDYLTGCTNCTYCGGDTCDSCNYRSTCPGLCLETEGCTRIPYCHP